MAWQTLSLLLCYCQSDCVELSVTQKCEQVPTTSRNEAAAALEKKEKKKGKKKKKTRVRDMFHADFHKWHTERHAALNSNARLSEQEDALLEIEVTFS